MRARDLELADKGLGCRVVADTGAIWVIVVPTTVKEKLHVAESPKLSFAEPLAV